MDLTTEVNDSLYDNTRKGYLITGISLETNLRVNKRHVSIKLTKKVLDFISNTLDQAHRRDDGSKDNRDLNRIIVPVKSNQIYDTQTLDSEAEKARQYFWRKFNLHPRNGGQYFIRLTLISNDGVNRHQSRMLSYVSDETKEALLVYGELHSCLVHYDDKGRVVPLELTSKSIPLLEMIK